MKPVTVSINKTANSKIVTIAIRDGDQSTRIKLNQEDFTNALFGLSEVPAEKRIKTIMKGKNENRN